MSTDAFARSLEAFANGILQADDSTIWGLNILFGEWSARSSDPDYTPRFTELHALIDAEWTRRVNKELTDLGIPGDLNDTHDQHIVVEDEG